MGSQFGGYGGSDFADAAYAGQATTPTTTFSSVPSLTVLVAFTSQPITSNPVWTDVSPDLRAFTTRRGRQRELDQWQAGTASITLDNRSRNYDPNYSAGPYFGNVLPNKKIRIQATQAGITYTLFDGFVDAWQQNYQMPREATVTVTATDAFKPLARFLLRSAYGTEVIKDSPIHWWRLGEPSGATSAFDAIGSDTMTQINGTVTFGATGLVAKDADTAVSTTSQANDGLQLPGDNVNRSLYWTTAPLTIEVIHKPSSIPNVNAYSFSVFNTAQVGVGIGQDGLGHARFVVATSNSATGVAIVGTTVLATGTTYHLAGVWDTDGSVRLYVNGSLEASSSTPVVNFAAGTATAGVGVDKVTGTALSGTPGTLDEAAVYNTALSGTRIKAHSDAAAAPWNGDTPATRIGRILDALSWPAASARNLDTGSSVLQTAPDTTGQVALTHMQNVEKSEFGSFFITGDGTVRFMGRNAIIDQPSLRTFGDSGSELGYTALTYDYGDIILNNSYTIQRDGGVRQTTTDAASVNNNFNHSVSQTGLYHNSDVLSKNAADFLVSEYKDPKLRISSIRVAPQQDPTNLYPQVLGRELNDRITVNRRPQGVGSVISQDALIQGIQHSYTASGPLRWQTTWQLSPAFTRAIWELGITGFSELGTNTTLWF